MTEITGRTKKGGLKTWAFRQSGLARVEAVDRSSEENAAEDGDAYAIHGVCRTAAAASGVLLYMKNTSSVNQLHLTRIYIDPQTLTDADLLITQWHTPTTTTGGTDITTAGGIIQKNTGKNNALEESGLTVIISDAASDMTFTGGTKFHEIPVTSRVPIDREVRATNIIAPGGEWFLGFKLEDGSAAVGDQIISLTINGFVEEEDRE